MLGQAERLVELKNLFGSKISGNSIQGNTSRIAFTSGKGGTGKTFLSLNISYELARLNKKVLYIDLDFNMANAHLLLDINPTKTISDYFGSRELLADIIREYSTNFHLIFGDSGKTGYSAVSDEQLKSLFTRLGDFKDYDFIILDLPAGAGREVMNVLRYADYSIVVATTEPTAVMDAYALTKLMKYENIKCEQYCIINKCRYPEEGELAYSNLNSASLNFLKQNIKLLSCIDYTNEAYESVCSQKLLAAASNKSSLSAQIRASSHKISEINHLANIHQSVKVSL